MKTLITALCISMTCSTHAKLEIEFNKIDSIETTERKILSKQDLKRFTLIDDKIDLLKVLTIDNIQLKNGLNINVDDYLLETGGQDGGGGGITILIGQQGLFVTGGQDGGGG